MAPYSLFSVVLLTWAISFSLLTPCYLAPSPSLLSPGEAEGVEEVKMATLQRRRNQLAGYCKLVIYGILDLSTATDVFKYYSKVEKTEGRGEKEGGER